MDKRIVLLKINRGWRILTTGFCFSIFGIGGLILTITWFPLLRLFIKEQNKYNQMIQKSIQYIFKFFISILRTTGTLNVQFKNSERFNDDAGCIIIANHPSLLDYVFLASIMPRCDCLVKESLQNNFFMKGVIKAASYITNSKADSLLPACQEKLDNRGMILIFPEGTRTPKDRIIKIHRGAANIALRTEADLRLVSIYCDFPMLMKGEKWYNVPPEKPTFTVSIDNKLNIKNFITSENELTVDARRLTRFLQQQLEFNLKNTMEGAYELK